MQTRKNKRGATVAIFATIAIMVGLWVGPAMAGDEEEFFIQHAMQKYFYLPQNARSMGMGGAIVPVETGTAALFGNPAGLARSERVEMSLSYQYDTISGEEFLTPAGVPTFDDIDEDFNKFNFQAAIPLNYGDSGVLGLGLSFYDSDVDDSVDTDTDGWRLHLGYGYSVDYALDLGLSITYFNDEEDNDFSDYEMDDGFLIKPGLRYDINEYWSLGVAFWVGFGDTDSDIVTGLDGDGDRLSFGIDFGVGWQVGDTTLLAAAFDISSNDHDADVNGLSADEDGTQIGFHIGIEQEELFQIEWLDARAGYRFAYIDYDFDDSGVADNLSDEIDIHALSAGLSWIPCDNFSLDYAIEHCFVGDGDFTHAVTLNILF